MEINGRDYSGKIGETSIEYVGEFRNKKKTGRVDLGFVHEWCTAERVEAEELKNVPVVITEKIGPVWTFRADVEVNGNDVNGDFTWCLLEGKGTTPIRIDRR